MARGSNKLTTEQFIAKAQAVHGDTYDYSQVVYLGGLTPVIINCSKHGAFEQMPASHVTKKAGCPSCGRDSQHSKQAFNNVKFLAQAAEVHGNTYDYSRVDYKNSMTKVCILCRYHGAFWQRPCSHLTGRGCGQCALAVAAKRQTYSLEDFVAKAILIHGERYDYSKTIYNGSHQKAKIECVVHGIFEQAPSSHLSGKGCRRCSDEQNAVAQTHSLSDFLQRARAKHGDFYDYSQVVYVKSSIKVKIICPAHGLFEQLPASHTTVIGCPGCGRDRTKQSTAIEWTEKATGNSPTLYFLRFWGNGEEFYKVGITYHTVEKRFKRAGALPSCYQYEILAVHQSTNAAAVYDWEQSILETFAHLKYQPETPFAGQTECFSSCEEILEIFPL